MFEILTVFLVYLFSLNIAAFFGVALLTLFFQIKKRSQGMQQEKWTKYFEKIGPKGLLIRLYVSYMLALSLLAAINYVSFFNYSLPYTFTLLIAGFFHLTYKYQLNKDHLKHTFH